MLEKEAVLLDCCQIMYHGPCHLKTCFMRFPASYSAVLNTRSWANSVVLLVVLQGHVY